MMSGMKLKIRSAGRPVTAIVLAGGRGRRMNADKARLPVPGGTLLERVLGQLAPHFDEVLVSVSPGQKIGLGRMKKGRSWASADKAAPGGSGHRRALEPDRPNLRIVEDERPDQGPMAGVLAGLKAAGNAVCAVVACDIPDVDMGLLRRLVGAAAHAEIAVPVTPEGDFEPLFAVYQKAVVPRIEKLLSCGERSLIPLISQCRTARVPLADGRRLRNLNTRRDYEDYLKHLKGKRNRE